MESELKMPHPTDVGSTPNFVVWFASQGVENFEYVYTLYIE